MSLHVLVGLVVALVYALPVSATQPRMMDNSLPQQHQGHAAPAAADTLDAHHADTHSDAHSDADSGAHSGHAMFSRTLDSGWRVLGMGQVFPVMSRVETAEGGQLQGSQLLLTQPVAMLNLESPSGRFALRFSPNFEFATLADGERSIGGWGEGFIDSRHPHTAIHEFMVSVNSFGDGLDWSLSAGKGFAPFGTEDPMSRPVLKYPTNHHLSQILERFTLNGVVLWSGWSVEAGVFGGSEPESPWDLSNFDSFGDSWSLRVARRLGNENAWGTWPLEIAGSWAEVAHEHHGTTEITSLVNGQVRLDTQHELGRLNGLVEASRSDNPGDDDFWSVLAEARLTRGPHQPYARVEWATRPEYERDAASGAGFLRYDHDAHIEGASRWNLWTVGYGYSASGGGVSLRPFAELQWAQVSDDARGPDVTELFGARRAWGLSLGARIFFGGDPMRMGTYGVLDPMTRMSRGPASMQEMSHSMHHP